jgi:hypothetical protein
VVGRPVLDDHVVERRRLALRGLDRATAIWTREPCRPMRQALATARAETRPDRLRVIFNE